MKRLERAKSKAEAVSRRHLDELALIRRLQRQKVGVGRKQKLTVQERETKKLLDAKVRNLRLRRRVFRFGRVRFGFLLCSVRLDFVSLRSGSFVVISIRSDLIRFCWARFGVRCDCCFSRLCFSSRTEIVVVTLTGGSSRSAPKRRVDFCRLFFCCCCQALF